MAKKKKSGLSPDFRKRISVLSIITGLAFTLLMTYVLQNKSLDSDANAAWQKKEKNIQLASIVYDDNLAPGWKEWSSADVDAQERRPTYSGSKAISFITQNNSAELYFYTRKGIDTSFYGSLHLAVRATMPGQDYGIRLLDENEKPLSDFVSFETLGTPLKQNEWVVYDIPLTTLKATSAKISGVAIKGQKEFLRKKIFIDDIRFIGPQTTPMISVSPQPSERISPSTIPTTKPITKPPTQPTPTTPAPTSGATGWWKPTPDKPINWHWQLSQDFVYPRDVVAGVTVYDIDGEYATADTVAKLHALGPDIKVICYFDAGVFEDYRSDVDKFPKSVIGSKDVGWDGSYWLDIRQTDILLPIMRDRMVNWCKNKGFDAIEPDETEVWSNNSGFNITKEQNNFYNRKLAEMAHELGMSIGLKGNTTETPDLWPYFDWTLNEECWQYKECDLLKKSFIDNGKAVLNIEYKANPNCAQANQWRMNSAKRDLNLVGPTHNAYRYTPCIPDNQKQW